jgi:hypothetical protein
MIGKPKSVKMTDLMQARHEREHKEVGRSRPAKVCKGKKPVRNPARPFLENDGWVLYHSGGGCIVWAKATKYSTMYMGSYNERTPPADMTLETPCGVSVSDQNGECYLNMYFPSIRALIDACIKLEGDPVKMEPANERKGVMRCPTCGASSTCFNCRDSAR